MAELTVLQTDEQGEDDIPMYCCNTCNKCYEIGQCNIEDHYDEFTGRVKYYPTCPDCGESLE